MPVVSLWRMLDFHSLQLQAHNMNRFFDWDWKKVLGEGLSRDQEKEPEPGLSRDWDRDCSYFCLIPV